MSDSPPYSFTPKRLSGTKVFFVTILSVVIGMFLFFFLLIMLFVTIGALANGSDTISEPIVLEIDLRTPLIDSPVGPTLFGDSPKSVVGIVQSLNRAKTDDQIKGVFIRGETGGMAPASSEELRLALIDFRTSGKFVITHAQGLNSTSVIPYQAISASDEIWLQASTSVSTAGMYSQAEFFGGVMEKVGAQPEFIRHGAYKNAVNSYTEEGFTPEHREAMTSMLTSLFDNAVDNIATDRELSRDDVLALLNTAPHSARDAVDAGLVDTLGYFEDARKYAAEKAGDEDTVFKPIAEYKPKSNFGKPVIALIEGQGAIMSGQSGGDGIFNSATNIGSETMAAGLDAALKDDKVKAVILRVSSGGGSAAASDQIMAAVKRVQDADKPVIISMGQYAASGGYYFAAPADHIVAMPQTITGSIGVFGGKIAFENTFAKVGYNLDSIRIGGDFAGVYNIDEPFTDTQRASYQREMDKIYDDFVGIVAEGRNMSREAVIAVAEGRVWTGEQALERGLVDELGGFETALRAAKRFAELDEDAAVRVKRFPHPKSREELFNDLLSGTASTGRDLERLGALMNMPEVQAAIRMREQAMAAGNELNAQLPTVR
ncbi:protease [Algimonas arctica]|uniref:Protease n=1 Tax=Algimonas arctica TaxID=1479486 RepID=A0A8J3CQ32_9PROT|nr:signal peptide peptidase SppA [Algimonas arctica]GHA93345.1 protease [Algimonas arctica]